jgi:parallel beta-helix repeat protein
MHNSVNTTPMVTRCSFYGNTAGENGGGMLNDASSSPTVYYCSFTGNIATGNGGGMYNDDSSDPTVTYCSFSGNTATYYGGGIYNDDSDPEFTNCLFSGNIAHYGGGIYNDLSSPRVTNCSFSGNATAAYYGDGMFNINTSNPIIINSIFWDINVTISGKDIYNDDSTSTPTIAYSNIMDSGGSGSWDSNLGTDGGGNIDADPLFTALGYWNFNGTPGDPSDDWWSSGNYRLLPGSPCIDAGDSTEVSQYPETIDMSSNPRVLNDPIVADTGISIMYQPRGIAYAIDMGAYEYQPCLPEIPCDFNCDDQVDMLDFSIFAAHWLEGTTP